jgi:hypothetical protein
MIKTPLKKIEKNNETVDMYILFMLLSYGLFIFYNYTDAKIPKWSIYKTSLVFSLSMIFFLLCWFKDPGYL